MSPACLAWAKKVATPGSRGGAPIPRYLTLMAPAGEDARIWMGRFDEKFTKVEAWVRVTADGPQCWQSQAWIEPVKSTGAPMKQSLPQDEHWTDPLVGAGGLPLAGRGAAPRSGSSPNDTAPAAASARVAKGPGAVFALRNAHFKTPVAALDAKGRELMAFNCAPRGRGLFGRFYDLVCDGGSFLARDAGPWVGLQVARSGAFTIEVTLTPAESPPKTRGVVLAYG